MNDINIYARRFKTLNEMTIQEVSNIINDTTTKDNVKYIYDLAKELYKLGVDVWFLRNYKNFSLHISHLNYYSTAGNLEVRLDPGNGVMIPLVYNPFTECKYLIHFCSDKISFQFDFRDSKTNEPISILEKNFGYDDYTKAMIFFDVKNIFTYEEERCLKWKYPLDLYRWIFKSDF
jgi:hypothetical protein